MRVHVKKKIKTIICLCIAIEVFGAESLVEAVRRNDCEAAGRLLIKKANVNEKDKRGRTPLFAANSPQMVQLLIGHNANVHHKTVRKENLLHNAVESNKALELFVEFCNRNVDVHALDELKMTPMRRLFDSGYEIEGVKRRAAALMYMGVDLCTARGDSGASDSLWRNYRELSNWRLRSEEYIKSKNSHLLYKANMRRTALYFIGNHTVADKIIDFCDDAVLTLKDVRDGAR